MHFTREIINRVRFEKLHISEEKIQADSVSRTGISEDEMADKLTVQGTGNRSNKQNRDITAGREKYK